VSVNFNLFGLLEVMVATCGVHLQMKTMQMFFGLISQTKKHFGNISRSV